MIIHITGPSGCGKTTLGNKLKKKFGTKIVVKDIDDLRQEFIKDFYGNTRWTKIDAKAYQQYLDNFILRQTKPLVLVGLNVMPWWHKNLYYDMHSDYNFYIQLDNETILKQKCLRLFKDFPNDTCVMKDLVQNNDHFVKKVSQAIVRECSLKEIEKSNKTLEKDYKAQGYKFITREEIFNVVSSIINPKVHKKRSKSRKN